MPLLRPKHINRQHLRAKPDHLFVFSDNLARQGLAGQARAMRGEPNAIGLPTKASPYEYLKDSDLSLIISATALDRQRIISHISSGGTVVWPADGIGTGLAQLRSNAPSIANFYDLFLIQVEDIG